jgi:hypothetical protein
MLEGTRAGDGRGVTIWAVKLMEGEEEELGAEESRGGVREDGRGSRGVGWMRKGRMALKAREDVSCTSYYKNNCQ